MRIGHGCCGEGTAEEMMAELDLMLEKKEVAPNLFGDAPCGLHTSKSPSPEEIVRDLDIQRESILNAKIPTRNELLEFTKPVGVKHDEDKIQWHLIPWGAMEMVARVFMFGAKKYSPGNWKLVENGESRYVDAAMRNLVDHMQGNLEDSESDLFTLAHAAASALMALGRRIETYNADMRPNTVKSPHNFATLPHGGTK
jgi:hypothetical protein